MKTIAAQYVTSAAKVDQFPPESGPEVAFVGRSNVGKSSLINSITGQRGLAKTSKTPGRTQMINWFSVRVSGKEGFFVDLPGYGFAKTSASVRRAWGPLIETYLSSRGCLQRVIWLLDCRRKIGQEEHSLLEWLRSVHQEPTVVITKSDKLSKSHRKPAGETLAKALGLRSKPLLLSAKTGLGIEDLWRKLTASIQ